MTWACITARASEPTRFGCHKVDGMARTQEQHKMEAKQERPSTMAR